MGLTHQDVSLSKLKYSKKIKQKFLRFEEAVEDCIQFFKKKIQFFNPYSLAPISSLVRIPRKIIISTRFD